MRSTFKYGSNRIRADDSETRQQRPGFKRIGRQFIHRFGIRADDAGFVDGVYGGLRRWLRHDQPGSIGTGEIYEVLDSNNRQVVLGRKHLRAVDEDV